MQRIHLTRCRLATLAAIAMLALGGLFVTTTDSPSGAAAAHAATPVASGVSPATLRKAHWDCLDVVHAVHCLRPGALAGASSGTLVSFSVLVFDTHDPASRNAPFLGSEFNIRADHFHGQPCPTDPPSRRY